MILGFWAFVATAIVFAEHGSGAVAGGAAVGFLAFWLESILWPWAKCWWCRADPRRYNVDGSAWRHCPRCGGSGRRRRPLAGRWMP